MKKHLVILSFMFLIFSQTPAFAGAWTHKEDHGEVMLTGRYFKADSFNKSEVNPYVEWGLSDKTTLGANLGYAFQSGSDSGYAELFLRRLLIRREQSVLSAQLMAGVARRNLSSSAQSHYGTTEARLLAGWSSQAHSWGSLYFDAQMGYRIFFEDVGSELRSELSLGWKFQPRWILLLQSFGTLNMNEPLTANDYDDYQLQGSVVFPICPKWSGQVGYAHTTYSKNALEGSTFLASLWYQF